MTFREYFERISIINLAERTDRRREMLWELERAGLSPEVGRIEFFTAIKVPDAAGFENAGYHGCFLSHLAVLKQARDMKVPKVLVFEDDAAISSRFKQDEDSIVEQLRAIEWGIVYFGHGLEGSADRPAVLRPFPDGAPLAHFYAVNGRVLDRLIGFMEKMRQRPAGHPEGGPMSPDGAMHVFLLQNPDVPSHVASPSLGGQRSSRSDLLPKWFDQVPGLRQTASTFRKVKRWLRQT
jgi:glycosyl transferase, family 25